MKHSGDSSEQQMKWPESMKALVITSNILVAGAPKQGKSTAIGVIVDALKSYPEAYGMQFRVIDTSKPHWDADETIGELCRELERRETLHNVGVDISGVPMIVTVIDEYSDLMEFGSRDSRRSVKDSVLRLAKEGAEVRMRLILSSRHPSQEIKSLLPYLHTRLVLRVSDRKDSKLLLKSEAAFCDLNSIGDMFLYDKGDIVHCSLSGVIY